MKFPIGVIIDSFRTDIPEQEFIRVTIHTMEAACEYYADGFVWGSEENRDYTPELLILKEMILKQWPQAEILIMPAAGVCSYYVERKGLIVGFD